MTEDFLQVFGEVCVEYWSRAGFLFVRLRQRDALGKGAAQRLDSMKDCHGPLIVFNHDFRARAHVSQERRYIGSSRFLF